MNSQKCISCGRKATRIKLVLDGEIGTSEIPICDSYPFCGFSGNCSENSGYKGIPTKEEKKK